MLQKKETEPAGEVRERTAVGNPRPSLEGFPINRVVVRVPKTTEPADVELYEYTCGVKPDRPQGLTPYDGTPIRNFAFEEHLEKQSRAVLTDAVFTDILNDTLDGNLVNGVATLRQVIELAQQSDTGEIQRIIDTPFSDVSGQSAVEIYNKDAFVEFYFKERLLFSYLDSDVYLVGCGTKALRDFVIRSGIVVTTTQ